MTDAEASWAVWFRPMDEYGRLLGGWRQLWTGVGLDAAEYEKDVRTTCFGSFVILPAGVEPVGKVKT